MKKWWRNDEEVMRIWWRTDETMMKQWWRQDCYRVLVSIISWPGQLLSLNPCQRPKILARMLFFGILCLTVVILEIKALSLLLSVLCTSCVVIIIRDVSIAQRRLTQALDRKTLSSEVVSLAGCLATVPRSWSTGTQGGWVRRMRMGIWWEPGRSIPTMSSSSAVFAMWRGSTVMVEEAVWSNILNLGSRQRLRMGKKEGWLASRDLGS